MDDRTKQNSVSSPDRNSHPPPSPATGEFRPEQTMTPNPTTLGIGVLRARNSDFTFTLHWTVRLKVTTMTDREASILLKVLVVEFLERGIDLSGYLAVEYLVQFVMKGKLDPLEIREEKDRQAVMLGYFILSAIRGSWTTLDERITVTPSVISEVLQLGWLPDKRTYNSWRVYHSPRSFLEILTVPLDVFNERNQTSTRYSGYTKGYGNGGHISRVSKTPYDSEIDGESTDREPPEFSLQQIEQYNRLLLVIEKEKMERLWSLDK